MPNAAHRKARERFFLERFISVSGVAGTILAEEEAPDFALSVDDRVIGVEVTELFAGATPSQLPLQAHEALSTKVVKASRKAYEACGGSPLHASIGFFSGIDLRSIHRDTLARALATLLLELRIPQGRFAVWQNDYTNPDLSPIAFINALGVTAPEFAHWYAGSGGFSVPLTLDQLQACVAEKNARARAYRQRYEEVWLIVATEGARPSQFFDIASFTDAPAVKSDFDRTYFLISFTGQLLRLGF